jgi:hypothetical protein
MHPLGDQLVQPGVLGQAHHRHQPGEGHDILTVENNPRAGRAMQQSHPRDAFFVVGF